MLKRGLIAMAALAAGFVLVADARADVVEAEEVIVGEEAPPPAPMVEPEPDYNRLGPYLGLGASYYVENFGSGEYHVENGGPVNVDFEDTWGFNARGGWRFLPWLAAEGVYEYASNFRANLSRATPGRPGGGDVGTAKAPSNTFTVNAKGILPLGRVQPYLSGGIGFVNVRIRSISTSQRDFDDVSRSQTDFAGRVAAGSDVFITEHIGLFVEGSYLMPIDKLQQFNYFGVHFGGKYAF